MYIVVLFILFHVTVLYIMYLCFILLLFVYLSISILLTSRPPNQNGGFPGFRFPWESLGDVSLFGKVIWRMLNVCWLQKMIRTKSTDNIYPGFWVEFHRNLLIALHMVGFIGGIRFKTVWPDLNSTKLGEISSDSPSRFFFWKSNSKVTMVSMCLFGVTNFAGTLQGEIHISHQTGKGKSSTLGKRYVSSKEGSLFLIFRGTV